MTERAEGENRLFEGWVNVRKTLYIIYEFPSHPSACIVLKVDVPHCVDSDSSAREIAFRAFRSFLEAFAANTMRYR